jgi:hypothetical protein
MPLYQTTLLEPYTESRRKSCVCSSHDADIVVDGDAGARHFG